MSDVREFGVYVCSLALCPSTRVHSTNMTKICVIACTGRKHTCAAWLKSHGITTVAMESTGSYWQNLYDILIESGFEVFLLALCARVLGTVQAAHVVAGRQTKNTCAAPSASMEGKTDACTLRSTSVKDSRWIQFLHSVGLLTSSFLPDIETEELRTLFRHRDFLLKQAAKYTCALHLLRTSYVVQVCPLGTKYKVFVRCKNVFV